MIRGRYAGAAVLLLVTALYVAPMVWRFFRPEEMQLEAGGSVTRWEFASVAGPPLRSDDFKGRVVLLDFWASWCAPCLRQIPALNYLRSEYPESDLAILGISQDDLPPGVIAEAARRSGIQYPVGTSSRRMEEELGGVPGLPTMILLDREGRVVVHHSGLVQREQIERAVRTLLGKEAKGVRTR